MKLGFIGVGKMATAMIKGFMNIPNFDLKKVIGSTKNENNMKIWEDLNIPITNDNNLVVKNSNVIFICVKPQVAKEMIDKLEDKEEIKKKIWVSIMAGKRTEWLTKELNTNKVIRIMPNICICANEGVCGIFKTDQITDHELKNIVDLLEKCNHCIVFKDEDYIDSLVGLAGSGPAYIFRVMEGMIQGGINVGFTEEEAAKLTFKTIRGAVTLAEKSWPISKPNDLREDVTSPNGTTEAALKILNKNNVMDAFNIAVQASKNRSIEISKN